MDSLSPFDFIYDYSHYDYIIIDEPLDLSSSEDRIKLMSMVHRDFCHILFVSQADSRGNGLHWYWKTSENTCLFNRTDYGKDFYLQCFPMFSHAPHLPDEEHKFQNEMGYVCVSSPGIAGIDPLNFIKAECGCKAEKKELRETIKILSERLKIYEEKFEMLWYAPGNPGYLEAKLEASKTLLGGKNLI
jgi:hypothetical protein